MIVEFMIGVMHGVNHTAATEKKPRFEGSMSHKMKKSVGVRPHAHSQNHIAELTHR